MKKIIALAALMICGAAQAQSADATAGAQSGAAAQAGSNSGAAAIITMPSNPDHVTYTNNSTSTSTVNGTTTSNVNQNVSGSQTLRNVPNIGMSGPASGPCTGPSGGVTVAAPGVGVGINGATTESDCQIREMARILAMVGDMQGAKEALHYTDAAQRVRERKAQAESKPVAVTQPAPQGDICAQARAKNDVALASRVCK